MEDDIFREEAYELLDEIEATLLELRDNPDDSEQINRLFRAVHTIKGSGAMFGFTQLAEFTHKIESAIDAVREGDTVLSEGLTDLVLDGHDHIQRIIEAPDPDHQEIKEESARIINALNEILTGEPATSSEPEEKTADDAGQDNSFQEFRDEILELLDEFAETIAGLKTQPGNADLIDRLFRITHTVNEFSGMYGLDVLVQLTGQLKKNIADVMEGASELNDEALALILDANNHLVKVLNVPDSEQASLQQASKKLAENLQTFFSGSSPSPDSPGKKLKILIVEDEFTGRYLLQEFLFPYGICHVAVDGFEAVTAVKTALTEKPHYDLICLDIMMPGIDGRKVSEEIRRIETEANVENPCKIVMTTAVSEPETIKEMLELKLCDAYLVKPLDLHKLAELIKTSFPQRDVTLSE